MLLRTAVLLFLAASLSSVLAAQPMPGGVRVVYAFPSDPGGDCEIELTRDSVRILSNSLAAERRLLGGRLLSASERDSAGILMALASRWSGYRRYACRGGGAPWAAEEGYGFSLWTDSLLLACDNCFSCSGGLSLPEAQVLARFGRMSLWLYRMRETRETP